MLRAVAKYFYSIPPVFVDGLLYCAIALFIYLQTQFGSDEAAKYVEPETLWWTNVFIGGTATVLGALKMYRSTSYAEHQQKKVQQNETP